MTRPPWTYWHPKLIINSQGISLQIWWWQIPRYGITSWWPGSTYQGRQLQPVFPRFRKIRR